MLVLACSRISLPKLIGSISRRYISSIARQHQHLRTYPRLTLCCRLINTDFNLQRQYATQKSASGRIKLSELSPEDQMVVEPLNLRSNKTFHASDGLNPSEWTLIYRNPDYEKTKNVIPLMIIFGVFCTIFLTFALILVYTDRDQMNFEKSDLLFLGWPLGIGLVSVVLSKFRRRYVLRIYEGRTAAKASSKKRRYCIVWLNSLLQKRPFIYDHTETREACERYKAVAGLLGNFKAKGRPWHVKAECFERPQDYFNVRLASDVGKD